jgi:beta-glucanase (GH16 family)
MEFLSKDYNDTTGLVNLVLQSSDSALHKDAANTDTYTKAPLDFRPDQAFHEYRFDWTPDRVTFFVDGKPVSTMEKNVPKDGSLMTLNHWSNGNELWSAGPPAKDTAMTVSYVKAYFNSSSTAREDEYKKRCPIFDPAKVCQIPDQTSAPNGNNAKTYFFSQDGEGKTPGQETYKPTSGAAILFSSSISIYIGTSVFVAFFSWLLL